jgi:hypothetical protein
MMKMKEQREANHACKRNVQTRWKGMALAVPDSARSNLGFSPGPPRLKPNSSVAGFRRAEARRFHPRRGISCLGINNRGWGSLLALAACIAAVLLSAGCSRAPSFNILGSFFPAWLLCGVIGIALAVVTRLIFLRTNFERELSPLILVYPCLALFYTFTTWLLFFS